VGAVKKMMSMCLAPLTHLEKLNKNNMSVPHGLQIGDEVLVLYDRHGTGLMDIINWGKIIAKTELHIQVKGWIFKKWYPLNNFYLICKIEK
jgi:hypothetical protein